MMGGMNKGRNEMRVIEKNWKTLLAEKIADHIFSIGDEMDRTGKKLKTNRIAFMIGPYETEISAGGMCKESLVSAIVASLKE